uniref:targeting protein for Xklp2 isoform X2 n=1 Tax=Ciona intestinalis TaxID=7719 RepID=UPI00089DD034|nr:targeting protein for Xklp2 isoform X2 [Ciona intestinalis]|eukprot:XP_018666820.1 targeting protein for Xklp2 isoform X2 [Ciona intestinalis]
MAAWEYDAPNFVDFDASCDSVDDAEAYFNRRHSHEYGGIPINYEDESESIPVEPEMTQILSNPDPVDNPTEEKDICDQNKELEENIPSTNHEAAEEVNIVNKADSTSLIKPDQSQSIQVLENQEIAVEHTGEKDHHDENNQVKSEINTTSECDNGEVDPVDKVDSAADEQVTLKKDLKQNTVKESKKPDEDIKQKVAEEPIKSEDLNQNAVEESIIHEEDLKQKLQMQHESGEVAISEVTIKQECIKLSIPAVQDIKLQSDNINTKEESVTPSEVDTSEKKAYSNIMTPSRLASWNTAKPKVVPKAKLVKSAPKKSATPNAPKPQLRRSIRNTDNIYKTPEPPIKKKKLNNEPKKNNHKRILTSEERQLEEVKCAKEKAQQIKHDSEMSLKKIRSRRMPSWNMKTKPSLTVPKEFQFKTTDRATKAHPMSTRSDSAASSSNDFMKDLRKHNPSPHKLKPTVVKPFHFSDDNKKAKRKLERDADHGSAFVPMAAVIRDFHKSTPKRFRARNENVPLAKNGPMKALKVTIPKTPHFSKIRSRPIATMSAKEKEELEVQEMKNYQFKAKEVSNTEVTLKKVEKKPSTVPVEFNLHTENRTSKQEDHEIKQKPFKARPVPVAILEKPTGIKEKQVAEVTIPQSPAFALKHRIKPPPVVPDKNSTKPTYYHPPPIFGVPFMPKVVSTKLEVKPFSFDKSDKERFAKKQEKIKQQKEKEAEVAVFTANPVPSTITHAEPVLANKKSKEPTKAKPFNLETDHRAANRAEKWSKNVEDEVQQLRDKTLFKANTDIDVVLKKPWKPKKLSRDPVVAMDPHLHSDERAKERRLFDEKLAFEKQQMAKLLEEQKKKQELQDKEEIARLRKSMEHKASEIKHYKTVTVALSEKKLTEPHSPHFSTRFKK